MVGVGPDSGGGAGCNASIHAGRTRGGVAGGASVEAVVAGRTAGGAPVAAGAGESPIAAGGDATVGCDGKSAGCSAIGATGEKCFDATAGVRRDAGRACGRDITGGSKVRRI